MERTLKKIIHRGVFVWKKSVFLPSKKIKDKKQLRYEKNLPTFEHETQT